MKDVSKATEIVMNDGDDGEYYHISGEEIISIKSLVQMICDMMKVNFDEHVELVSQNELARIAFIN